MKIQLKEGLTNPKEKTAKGLTDKVLGWYDFDTDYIDDGSQRRRAESKNENVVEWFGEHPIEIKKEAFKLIKSKVSKWGANYVSRFERNFGKHMKESIKEAKSLDDMMKDANRIKKELADVQKEYNKSKTETNKAKVEAKKGQLERVANAIRNARANQTENSIKESASTEAISIAQYTGTRKDAVQSFIDTHKLNAKKLLSYVAKGKLKDRMDFVSAISGKAGNLIQKKIIKMFEVANTSYRKYVNENESLTEVDYKTAVSQFNVELEKHPDIVKAAKHYGKTPTEIVKALQMRLSTKGDKNKNTKEVSIDYKDIDSGIKISHKKKFNEVVTEDVNWGTINNVFVKFLKANTKELEKRVNANDLDGTKAAIKSIISGLSNAQKSLKLEGVAKSTSLNEVTVTRIPNFNLESDAYIIMLYLLKNNSGFKKAATDAGIDLFSGANVKSVFTGLHNNLKKVITPQIIKAVVETINQDRKKIFIDDADIQKGIHTARFAGLLALGVVDSFINDPIDYKLINDLGNAKLKGLADEFSVGRGKIKLGAMLGNKGF